MICTKESRLGGRSAQFVAQFYNKKKNQKTTEKKIDYRIWKSISSRIEAARNCVPNKLCWAWQGSKEKMTPQIY